MTTMPKWANSNRQAQLIRLFVVSNGFCVFGHKNCPFPEHHYHVFIEGLIHDWIADDKARREAEWKAERRIMHSLAERRMPLRGQFSNIAKDIFFDKQPLFYLQGLGMSGLTFKPFAKVRLSSSFMVLYVDLGDTLRDFSKNRRHKIIRYGKGVPVETKKRIDKLVELAIDKAQK